MAPSMITNRTTVTDMTDHLTFTFSFTFSSSLSIGGFPGMCLILPSFYNCYLLVWCAGNMDEMKKVSGHGHLTPAPLSQTFEARAFPVGLGGHTGDRMESAGKGGIAAVSHHHRDLHNTEIGLYQ